MASAFIDSLVTFARAAESDIDFIEQSLATPAPPTIDLDHAQKILTKKLQDIKLLDSQVTSLEESLQSNLPGEKLFGCAENVLGKLDSCAAAIEQYMQSLKTELVQLRKEEERAELGVDGEQIVMESPVTPGRPEGSYGLLETPTDSKRRADVNEVEPPSPTLESMGLSNLCLELIDGKSFQLSPSAVSDASGAVSSVSSKALSQTRPTMSSYEADMSMDSIPPPTPPQSTFLNSPGVDGTGANSVNVNVTPSTPAPSNNNRDLVTDASVTPYDEGGNESILLQTPQPAKMASDFATPGQQQQQNVPMLSETPYQYQSQTPLQFQQQSYELQYQQEELVEEEVTVSELPPIPETSDSLLSFIQNITDADYFSLQPFLKAQLTLNVVNEVINNLNDHLTDRQFAGQRLLTASNEFTMRELERVAVESDIPGLERKVKAVVIALMGLKRIAPSGDVQGDKKYTILH